eukprot:403363222
MASRSLIILEKVLKFHQVNKTSQALNYIILPAFIGFLVLHINSVRKKENQNLFSLTILISMIVSVSIRIILSILYLFVFQDASLRGNIYQQIFFEIPYYCYIIVSYAVLFSWAQIYFLFTSIRKETQTESDQRIARMRLYLKIILITLVTALISDTLFVSLGAKQNGLTGFIFSLFWATASILFSFQILLLTFEICLYLALTRFFIQTSKRAQNYLLVQDNLDQVHFNLDENNQLKFEIVLAQKYQKKKWQFHLFFFLYIMSLVLRMTLYVEMRIESTTKSANDDGYIWRPISPEDHYFFYFDEFVQNLIMICYFYYINQAVDQVEKESNYPTIVDTNAYQNLNSSEEEEGFNQDAQNKSYESDKLNKTFEDKSD